MDGRILVNDKKVGVTGKGKATLKSRISQLSNTKNNFGAQCIAAWEIADGDDNSALYYENKLHTLLNNQVVVCNSGNNTEWFYDDGGEQHDIIELVSTKAIEWGLKVIDVAGLQDANAKALAKKATKASYTNVLSMVDSLTLAPFSSSKLTRDCVRVTTDDKRSFHINIRADLNKQYISVSKTKQNIEKFTTLCGEHEMKCEVSNTSGNLRVYVKTPREMARVVDSFYTEGV